MTAKNFFSGLDIVILIEEFIKAYSGEVRLRKLWQILPRRIRYSAFINIINYLQKSSKIKIDDHGFIYWTAKKTVEPYLEYA